MKMAVAASSPRFSRRERVLADRIQGAVRLHLPGALAEGCLRHALEPIGAAWGSCRPMTRAQAML